MRIGDVAAAAEIPPETVRYYEKRGLLAAPPRSTNGYRTYDDTALNQLRFIRTAQAAGLTLAEIRSVIELRNDGTTPCSHVEALLADKLADIGQRQQQLAVLEHELTRLERSTTLDPADCSPDDICHVLTTDRDCPNDAHAATRPLRNTRNLGRAQKEFRDGLDEGSGSSDVATDAPSAPSTSTKSPPTAPQ